VLVLFSSVTRSSELAEWDPLERLVRARVAGQITFHHAYLEEEKLKTRLIARVRRRLSAIPTLG
jgi:hypothetical protein